MASLFFITFATLMISCGGRSSNTAKQYSNEPTHLSSTEYSEEKPSTDYSEKESRQSDEVSSQSVNDKKKMPICNTKWSFTDARGNNFVLDIKEMDRNGKKARVEVVKNGEKLDDATIGYYPLMGFYDIYGCYEDVYFPSEKKSLIFSRWDCENNYLYMDGNAFDFEEPSKRISIKKIK